MARGNADTISLAGASAFLRLGAREQFTIWLVSSSCCTAERTRGARAIHPILQVSARYTRDLNGRVAHAEGCDVLKQARDMSMDESWHI